MRCPVAILLACCSIVGHAEAAVEPRQRHEQQHENREQQQQRRRRRHLQASAPAAAPGASPFTAQQQRRRQQHQHQHQQQQQHRQQQQQQQQQPQRQRQRKWQRQQQISQDATISGTVFDDLNRNGVREPDLGEGPLIGAVAKLYSCPTGSRVGTVRTGSDGGYVLSISTDDLPSDGSTGCFYVQFNVNGYILPNAVFTVPRNGETDDIYLGPGESAVFVDAGAYGVTPAPTWEWTTYPTGGGGGGGGDGQGVEQPPAPSPTPYAVVVDMDTGGFHDDGTMGEGHEAVGGSLAFETNEPSPAVVLVLPLPVDTVVLPAPAPTQAASPTMTTTAVDLPLPTDTAVALPEVSADDAEKEVEESVAEWIEIPQIPDVEETAKEEQPDASTPQKGDETEQKPVQEQEPEPQPDLPENEDMIKPSEEMADEPIMDSGVLSLASTVRVHLEGVKSEMDAGAQSTFEKVCRDFMDEQLEIATPPITNLDCAVVGQTLLAEGKRRLESLESGGHDSGGGPGKKNDHKLRSLRKLKNGMEEDVLDVSEANTEQSPGASVSETNSEGGESKSENRAKDKSKDAKKKPGGEGSFLAVDVEITGEAEKTKSIKEPEDVKFDTLLVGTFNVQGYLFAEALKEEEREQLEKLEEEAVAAVDGAATAVAPSPGYFESVGKVRGVQMNAAEAQEQDGAGEGGEDGAVFTKGVIAAIIVGGVVMILLTVIIVKQVMKRRDDGRPCPTEAGGAKAKRSANAGSSKANSAKAGSAKATAARKGRPRPNTPQAPTSPSNTDSTSASANPSPTKSRPAPQLTIAPSADSEDVEVGIKAAPILPDAVKRTSPRRVRRDVMGPPGKLGMMVANTKGHGPAIHTIRPGSPMEGLLFAGDIILAINDVDTRQCTAEQITRVMKDTVDEIRKITVLSKHR